MCPAAKEKLKNGKPGGMKREITKNKKLVNRNSGNPLNCCIDECQSFGWANKSWIPTIYLILIKCVSSSCVNKTNWWHLSLWVGWDEIAFLDKYLILIPHINSVQRHVSICLSTLSRHLDWFIGPFVIPFEINPLQTIGFQLDERERESK